MKTRISSRAAKASSEARFYRTGEAPCDWGFMHLESSNCPKGHILSANVYCVPTGCPHPALCPRCAALPSARASSRPHPRSGRTRAGRLFLVGAPQRSGKRARQGSPRTGAAAAAAAPPPLRPPRDRGAAPSRRSSGTLPRPAGSSPAHAPLRHLIGPRRPGLAQVVQQPPRPERGHWSLPIRAGHGGDKRNSASGKRPRAGARREPSAAAMSRIETERPEYDRRRPGRPEEEPSAAGRNRARPKGAERSWAWGPVDPAPWRPRGQLWPEAGLLAAAWPKTACSSLSARTLPQNGGAPLRCRVTPSAEPTSGAGSTWAGPGAECSPRS